MKTRNQVKNDKARRVREIAKWARVGVECFLFHGEPVVITYVRGSRCLVADRGLTRPSRVVALIALRQTDPRA